MPEQTEERVPQQMRPLYDEITGFTDGFCRAHLDEEYAALARKMAATLARKRPSPLATGRVKTWASGILVNGFIIDARTAPLPIQEEAFRKGLIPYIPAQGRPESG